MQNSGDLTERIIGCAIEVHRNLGPGLLESLYEKALCHEFETNNIRYANQCVVPILYKGERLGDHRLDFLIDGQVIVELKAVDRMEPVFKAQLLSYLRLTGNRLGLLINFNVPVLRDGIIRVIL
jgi:GxxExxY protein